MQSKFCPEGRLIDNEENIKYTSCVSALGEAMYSHRVLEGIAESCDCEHNLTVNLGCMKGKIMHDEGAVGIAEGNTRDIALLSRVGKSVCFIVTDIKTDRLGRPYALLSRKKAQEKCLANYISSLSAGDVIDARVTHLESFGAFCDIGCGIVALLPINSISVSRISHPKDRFFPGEDIKVIVSGRNDDGKITLSHKELLGTWAENAEGFLQGETVSGIVRSIESYGIFVELTPNLAGLAEPKPSVNLGETTSVFIKSIIPEKMKVKLIIIDSFKASYSPEKKYFFTGTHIDRFIYSPEGSYKTIVTQFLEK